MSPFKSLDAVDVTGARTSRDLEGVYNLHTLHVSAATIDSGQVIMV